MLQRYGWCIAKVSVIFFNHHFAIFVFIGKLEIQEYLWCIYISMIANPSLSLQVEEGSSDWQLFSILANHRKTITCLDWHPTNEDLLARYKSSISSTAPLLMSLHEP